MDDLTTLSHEELSALSEEKRAELAALLEVETPTDEQIEQGEALAADLDAIAEQVATVEAADEDRANRLSSLKERFTVTPSEDDADADADDDEPEVVDEVADEPDTTAAVEEPVVTARSAVQTLSAKTPRPKAPANTGPKPISITAAADVPDFPLGQPLDMSQVGEALVNRMEAFGIPSGDGKTENLQHYPVAKFKMEFPEELTVLPDVNDMAVLTHASRESRLPGNSLVAAGGWCAPSETLYDLCTTETTEGILSIPEVAVGRGGIKFTKGPEFADIYTNVGFLQTEAQAIAGTAKGCYEVPCPSFTDVRLDAIGLCIKAPILTNSAYPELVRRWLEGSMVAHAHKVNASVIGRIVTAAGTAEVVTDFSSTTQSTLSALELLANYKRQTYKLGLNASLEVVLPYWVKSAIRDDLSLRGGISFEAVTDQMIQSHFAARSLNVQFVYDWQELDTTNATEGYTATYTALIYPAGSFVKGTSDVITLNAVYDAASLNVNTYTALFFEQGLLVANVCMGASAVTLPVCNSGRTGIANISQCGLAVA